MRAGPNTLRDWVLLRRHSFRRLNVTSGRYVAGACFQCYGRDSRPDLFLWQFSNGTVRLPIIVEDLCDEISYNHCSLAREWKRMNRRSLENTGLEVILECSSNELIAQWFKMLFLNGAGNFVLQTGTGFITLAHRVVHFVGKHPLKDLQCFF